MNTSNITKQLGNVAPKKVTCLFTFYGSFSNWLIILSLALPDKIN